MSAPGSNPFPFPYMSQPPHNIDPSVAAALYHQQQSHPQPGLSGPQPGLFPPPPPSQPTPLSDTSLDSPDPSRGGSVSNASGKRPARDSDAARKKTKLDHDPEYYEDGEADAGAPSNSQQKIKQTRGSRCEPSAPQSFALQLKTFSPPAEPALFVEDSRYPTHL